MRELTASVREGRSGAVHASPTARLRRFAPRVLAFAVGVGGFLALVGAFGSDAMPALPRFAMFITASIVLMSVAFSVVTLLRRSPTLRAKPWLRRAVIIAILTPVTALLVWTFVGFAFMGAPKLELLPAYLVVSLGMTVAMSVLSQLVFRPERETGEREQADAIRPAEPEPIRFLERLPIQLKGADLYAVQAEDHYVRVHTSRGSTLILLRLADAAAELEGLEGARVHRSWWVARAAVSGAARRGSQTVLQLPGGLEAPVSRTQAGELKRAGWW